MLSNYNNTGMRSNLITLPDGNDISIDNLGMVLDYRTNIGNMDHVDQYASTKCFMRKSLKW